MFQQAVKVGVEENVSQTQSFVEEQRSRATQNSSYQNEVDDYELTITGPEEPLTVDVPNQTSAGQKKRKRTTFWNIPSSRNFKLNFNKISSSRKSYIVDGSRPEVFLSDIKSDEKVNGVVDSAPPNLEDQMMDSAVAKAKCLIAPNGRFRTRWDFVILAALAFTAIVTPVDVAFFEDVWFPSGLFFVNTIVDLIFFLDIFFNFCTPIHSSKGWVYSHKDIAVTYAKSWFFIDVVSVIPFGLIAHFYEGKAISGFKLFRFIRLLRITKLLRIFRASRILKRWETRISWPYSTMTLIRFGLCMGFLAHWMACTLRLIVDIEGADVNWMNYYFEVSLDNEILWENNWWAQYVASLYWATATVTTIGYGDVVAKTDTERLAAIGGMMIGGSVYAYVVGGICGVVASMGELTAQFHRKMDDLNKFMAQLKLPYEQKVRLREYFHSVRHLAATEHYEALYNDMSRNLRDEVSVVAKGKYVARLPFVDLVTGREKIALIANLCQHLTIEAHPPLEKVAKYGDIVRETHIVTKGAFLINRSYFIAPKYLNARDREMLSPRITFENILKGVKRDLLMPGDSFGHEMIVRDAKRRYHIIALTYSETYKLHRETLLKIMHSSDFPESRKKLRRYELRLALLNKFVRAVRMAYVKKQVEKSSGDHAVTHVEQHVENTEHAENMEHVENTFSNQHENNSFGQETGKKEDMSKMMVLLEEINRRLSNLEEAKQDLTVSEL